MDTTSSLNELEQLDALLCKTDAVRYALPAVVQALSKSTSSSNKESLASSGLTEYRKAISRASEKLNELGQAADAGSELIQRLLTRYEVVQPSQALLKRSRYDPYKLRHAQNTSENASQVFVKVPVSRKPDHEQFTSLSDLRRIIAKHEGVTLERASPAENPRIVSLALRKIARFHFLVTWSSENRPTLQRVAASAHHEKKRAYEESDMAIWREIGRQVPRCLDSATSKDALDLETLLASSVRSTISAGSDDSAADDIDEYHLQLGPNMFQFSMLADIASTFFTTSLLFVVLCLKSRYRRHR